MQRVRPVNGIPFLGTPDSIAKVTDGLVPALQRRGQTRRAYAYSTLRRNLMEF